MLVDYIDQHREGFGVEPICTALKEAGVQIAPSTYYAARIRPPSARAIRDAELVTDIKIAHQANLGVYGARKVHAELNRQDVRVARCTVERLMRAEGLVGSLGRRPARPPSATVLRPIGPRTSWTASSSRLHRTSCVADLTYVRTHAGWVYVAFVLDVFSRLVVGWQVSTSLRTDLALDALDMGLWTRQRAGHDVSGLMHHSDRGVHYRAIRYTERLAEAEAVASLGSKGNSYDNAMAEALNSLFKAECIRNPVTRPKGGWKNVGDVEIAVAEYTIGSTTDAFMARSASSRRPSTRPTIGPISRPASRPSTTLRHPSRPGLVPSNRASTKPGADSIDRALATVELPLHLNWSDRARRYDLRDRRQRARVYEIVLREGRPADVLTYVDGALLADLWDELVLPRAIRTAWHAVAAGETTEEVA